MGPETSPVLHLNAVSKAYGQRLALDHVSFDIQPGEFIGLLGPNGAGKSTLFQIVSGLFVPDEGKTELFGQDYKRHSADILQRLGVVFQARSVDLDMSVSANLKFHGGLFGLYGKKLAQRIAELAARFEFEDKLKRPVRNLSGGEQRRVEIARALLNNPDLLLMDEPSAGLDTVSRKKLVVHMRDLARERNTAILWATHLVDELDDADRIVVLAGGKVITTGSPDELMATSQTDSLTDAYVALTGTGAQDTGLDEAL